MDHSALPALPRRPSLAVETADFLRERLSCGAWTRELPGEMELAREIRVGRNTIRAALAILEKEGWFDAAPGRTRRILGPTKTAAKLATRSALILMPVPWHALPPSTLLWLDALRARLQASRWSLQFLVKSPVYRSAPAAALESLVAPHPSVAWILYRSTAAMQRWFEKRELCTVVAGSCHPGVQLPQVDTDFRATSRHAAAKLVALGHRQLAVLAPQAPLAGDDESLAGFREGAGNAHVQVLACRDSTASVILALRRMLKAPGRPTAVFAYHARHAATALTFLMQQGVRLPEQMSLLSRNHESFFQHLCPEPACYRREPDAFAKKLAHLVTALGEGISRSKESHLLMPAFAPGETLGPAPVPIKNR